jgi:hypothetical protein
METEWDKLWGFHSDGYLPKNGDSMLHWNTDTHLPDTTIETYDCSVQTALIKSCQPSHKKEFLPFHWLILSDPPWAAKPSQDAS